MQTLLLTARALLMATLRTVRDSAFGLFLLLVYLSPSLQHGPWVWLRLTALPWVGGETRSVGVLSLVPLLMVALWGVSRLREWHEKPWRWGERRFTLPLALYSALLLLSLWRTPGGVHWTQLMLLAALWLTYFYLLNERPRLEWVWVVILLAHGVVAVGQFLLQHEIGLYSWGEPILNPAHPGSSVFVVDGTIYVRGYGLTYHPNALAALMAVGLLALLTHPHRARPLAFLSGFAGLLVSFSRGGWLAFGAGAGTWLARRAGQIGWRRVAARTLPLLLLLILVALPFTNFITTRWFNINNIYEIRSLYERMRDVRIAIELMTRHPVGVGVPNYLSAAQQLDRDAVVVHNAFLLTGVEVGWAGLAAMLAFTIAGLFARRSPYHAAWVAWCVSNLFDIVLWTTTGLRGATMVGLLLALLQQEPAAEAEV